ncbi:MAG: hypothetical protein LBU68_01280 [Rickettsiales bacterium]|jgi:hypothetical protein|nr:hypothetical protein [Rickettsiales bacterium]
MKKILFILYLMFPPIVFASIADDGFKKTHENTMRLQEEMEETFRKERRGFGVSQEKLDMYRAAHPNYNFGKDVRDLTREQAEQILKYFWDNYRFGEIQHDKLREKIFDMYVKMLFDKFEKAINETISNHYKFGKYYEGPEWAKKDRPDFYAPFGSVSTISHLSDVKPENAEKILELLNEIEY